VAGTENMKRTRSFALLKDAYPRGITDLNTDPVQMLKSIVAQIAEHAQVAMLTIQTIFRRVMRMKSGHDGLSEV